MHRIVPACFMLSLVMLIGCGDPPEQNMIKQQRVVVEEAVNNINDAKSVADFQSAMDTLRRKQGEIFSRIRDLPKSRLRDFERQLTKEMGPLDTQLSTAISDFQKRLKTESTEVLIKTSAGDIKVALYDKLAPITVKNFLQYVDDKHYDGTIFHRVISDFMIQGGGFTPGMQEKEGSRPPIKNESDNYMPNTRGTLAMARTNAPNSATDQFFINVKDNDFLNRVKAGDGVGYAVFGKVTEGMDVVDKIRGVQTATRGGHENVPVMDVVIQSIHRVDSKSGDKKPTK